MWCACIDAQILRIVDVYWRVFLNCIFSVTYTCTDIVIVNYWLKRDTVCILFWNRSIEELGWRCNFAKLCTEMCLYTREKRNLVFNVASIFSAFEVIAGAVIDRRNISSVKKQHSCFWKPCICWFDILTMWTPHKKKVRTS